MHTLDLADIDVVESFDLLAHDLKFLGIKLCRFLELKSAQNSKKTHLKDKSSVTEIFPLNRESTVSFSALQLKLSISMGGFAMDLHSVDRQWLEIGVIVLAQLF